MSEQAFHHAAAIADIEAIRSLIESGANAAEVNKYNETPLHALAEAYHKKIYDYQRIYDTTIALLEAKASALRKEENGNLCYHWAASRGVYPMIQALIDKGVRLGMTDKDGYTAVHLACKAVGGAIESIGYAERNLSIKRENLEKHPNEDSWKKACREQVTEAEAELETRKMMVENYFLIVKAVVESGVDADAKSNYGQEALKYAVEGNAKKIAAYLKGEYSEDDEQSAATGGMTLHQACEKGDLDAVKALIARGDDVNEVSETTPFTDMTPLAVAIKEVKFDVASALLDAGADPNFKAGKHGHTAFPVILKSSLNYAADRDTFVPRIIKKMTDAGWDADDYIDDDSNTLLLAVSKSTFGGSNGFVLEDVLTNTLIGLGCDVNKANKNGVTPLMLMLKREDNETENRILTLLENGAQIDVCDISGNTPLMYAAANRKQSLARNYIELMSQFGDLKPDAVNNDGKTALDIATENGSEEVVKYILMYLND